MTVLGWLRWKLANIPRELALIYASLSIHLFLYLYIYIYIRVLHGISCSDPHLEHHSFQHSSLDLSLSLSFKYLPIKWIVNQQKPKFGKIILLDWWCWNLTNITRELALIYLPTSIHLYLYLHIYIYIYMRISLVCMESAAVTHT